MGTSVPTVVCINSVTGNARGVGSKKGQGGKPGVRHRWTLNQTGGPPTQETWFERNCAGTLQEKDLQSS